MGWRRTKKGRMYKALKEVRRVYDRRLCNVIPHTTSKHDPTPEENPLRNYVTSKQEFVKVSKLADKSWDMFLPKLTENV